MELYKVSLTVTMYGDSDNDVEEAVWMALDEAGFSEGVDIIRIDEAEDFRIDKQKN